jgi:hypothetical protein
MSWPLDIPVDVLAAIIRASVHETKQLAVNLQQPIVLVFTTGESGEWNIHAFQTRQQAKDHMENVVDSGSWRLEYAFDQGKQIAWSEKTVFDFVEVK